MSYGHVNHRVDDVSYLEAEKLSLHWAMISVDPNLNAATISFAQEESKWWAKVAEEIKAEATRTKRHGSLHVMA
jgi:hypothetical protein